MKTNAAGIALFIIFAFSSLKAENTRIFAQKLVQDVKAAHSEITGLELAATAPGKGCQTIAATDEKEVGEKCDQDEVVARKTNRPFVEQEKTEFDVTVPLHDSAGKTIATAGMDFKLETGRTKQTVVREALKIAAEMQQRLTSESDLFRPAP